MRVGIASSIAGIGPGTGHGQVWSRVLSELTQRVRLTVAEPTPRARVDVWLADGHAGPLDVRVPAVAFVHEIGWHTPELRALIDPEFATAIERATTAGIASAQHVVVPSDYSRETVIEACGVDPGYVHVIAHGVDSELFRPGLKGGRAAVAKALGARDETPYVLFASQLHPRKNVAAAREAVAGLARRGFDHVLAIVGSDPLDRADSTDLVRAAVADLPGLPGRVTRVTARSSQDMAALMAGADAFCLPSLAEGFGLTALEALACGTPAVVSDRGALPEVVGQAALVVAPEAAATEDALARILSDPALADELATAGRARAVSLTWGRTARGWLEVLERAAAD